MKLLVSLLVKHLVKKALKSATAAVTAGVVVGGTTIVIKPEYLDAIPEQYRGYVVLAIAGATLIARFRGEFTELVAEFKASR